MRRHHLGVDNIMVAAMTVQQAKNREFDGVVVLWPFQVGGDAEHKRRLLLHCDYARAAMVHAAESTAVCVVLNDGKSGTAPGSSEICLRFSCLFQPIIPPIKAGIVSGAVDLDPVSLVDPSNTTHSRAERIRGGHFDPTISFARDKA